jgi:hypothetical protein
MPVAVKGIKAFAAAACCRSDADPPFAAAVTEGRGSKPKSAAPAAAAAATTAAREVVGHLEAFVRDGSGGSDPTCTSPTLLGATSEELQWMSACLANAGKTPDPEAHACTRAHHPLTTSCVVPSPSGLELLSSSQTSLACDVLSLAVAASTSRLQLMVNQGKSQGVRERQITSLRS